MLGMVICLSRAVNAGVEPVMSVSDGDLVASNGSPRGPAVAVRDDSSIVRGLVETGQKPSAVVVDGNSGDESAAGDVLESFSAASDAVHEISPGKTVSLSEYHGDIDLSSMPKLSANLPHLKELGCSANVIRIRDLQKLDLRFSETDVDAVQYGMRKTHGKCYACGKQVAWPTWQDGREEGNLDVAVYKSPANGSDCQIDHLYPASLGGLGLVGNLFPICSDCNSLKGNMHPHVFFMLVVNSEEYDGKRLFDSIGEYDAFVRSISIPYMITMSRREYETLVLGSRRVSAKEIWLEQQLAEVDVKQDVSTLVNHSVCKRCSGELVGYDESAMMDESRGDLRELATMFTERAFSGKRSASVSLADFQELLPAPGFFSGDAGVDLESRVQSAVLRAAARYSSKNDASRFSALVGELKEYLRLVRKENDSEE